MRVFLPPPGRRPRCRRGELGLLGELAAGLSGWPAPPPLSLCLLAAVAAVGAHYLGLLSLGCSSPSPVAHSGASVLAVENRYPFIFIFYYPE